MSEYIIEVDYDTLNGTFSQKRNEEVVRCRDCRHISRDAYGGMRFCYRTEHEFIAEPTGFCAWGERRDA